ncbi:MAG: hypothetical protein ACI8Q1_002393 [Parvicella sp.]
MTSIKTNNIPIEDCEEHISSWKEFVTSYFKDLISSQSNLLNELATYTQNLHKNGSNSNKLISEHKQEFFKHIQTYYKEPGTDSFRNVHAVWLAKGLEIAEKFPVRRTKYQKIERFVRQPGDKLMSILKPLKNGLFLLSRTHIFAYNLFSKNKKEVNYWEHQVPLRNLFTYHYVIGFLTKWLALEEQISKALSDSLIEIKAWEEAHGTIEGIPARPNDDHPFLLVQDEILADIEDAFSEAQINFENDLELTGTIEYNAKKLSAESITGFTDLYITKWELVRNNWLNTLFALFEDWRSDLELDCLRYEISKSRISTNNSFEHWLKKSKDDNLSLILGFLSKTQNQFKEKKGKSELNKLIVKTQYELKKSFNLELIQPFQEKLLKNAILNQIDHLEHAIDKQTSSLSKAYAVTKYGNYDRAIESDELQSISNLDLISYEIIPWVEDNFDSIKSLFLTSMNELVTATGDLDEIVTYTLNTASGVLKDEKQEDKECIAIIHDGLNRAIEKAKEIELKLTENLTKSKKDLNQVLEELESRLQDLTDAENVFDIRLRISKAKAILKSVALKEKIWSNINASAKNIKTLFLEGFNWLKKYQVRLKGILIPSSLPSAPSRDVSDFLNESQSIMESLPLVYSRLYSIEPLTDQFLFEGRELEVSTIEQAFIHWQKGRSGSIFITGEKWSGLTSLINHVLSKNKFTLPTFRLELEGNHYDSVEMYTSFAQILGTDPFDSNEALIDYLNASEGKVIILEDIQKLYLKKIDGLKAVSDLIEIITSTRNRVFWMVTSTTYAAQFFEKTIQFSSYFSHHVVLKEMSPNQINNLVIKRNRISGFKVHFEEGEQHSNDKKYLKLNNEEKQEYLKTSFFKVVNNFAKSNVSMALLCWLLSTKKVADNTVYISQFKSLDLSFLTQLPMDQIFVLHALIQHDGLESLQVSEVLSFPLQKVKVLLLAMEEDGIIVREKNVFMVHTLVYRTVIQLLKSKNLIY